MKQFLFFPLILSFFLIAACNSDDESNNSQVTSQIKFIPKVGNENYSISDTVTYSNGNTLRYDDFKFYISNVRLIGTNGVETYVDSVELIDFKTSGKNVFDINLDSGPYEKIKFGIGLTPDLNSQDPTLVSVNHPLSTLHNMYWSWALMYRFITISGFYATNPNDDLTETFTYHPGRDQLYKEVELNLNQKHFYDDTVLEIKLDVAGLMDKTAIVDIENNPSWHGSISDIAVAQKIVDNFAASLSINN